MNEAINAKVNYQKLYLDSIKNSFVIKNPMIMFESKKQQLDLLVEKINKTMINNISNAKHKLDLLKNNHLIINPKTLYKDKIIQLDNLIDKLELLNPLNSLKRGYSITYKNNKVVNDINDISINDVIDVRINSGCIKAKVTSKKEVRHD